MDKEDAYRNFCYVSLLDIMSDAVRGEQDAAEALEDDFWVQFITTLDSGTMNYRAFMLQTWRLREDYRRGDRRVYTRLRKMRQALAFEGSTGEGAGIRHDGDERKVPGVQPIGAA